jgi:hypothetical protein
MDKPSSMTAQKKTADTYISMILDKMKLKSQMADNDYLPRHEVELVFKFCIAFLIAFYLLKYTLEYVKFYRSFDSSTKTRFIQ